MVSWRTRPDQPTGAIERARGFRREMSAGEAKLWQWLRGRKFEDLKFRRQVPIGRYVADFYCEAHKLFVEVDGGQHQLALQKIRDAQRDAYLAANGCKVVRVPALEVLNDVGASLARIRAVLASRAGDCTSAPHPCPLSRWERGNNVVPR
jgi:very-short-patch-repair endonuclease